MKDAVADLEVTAIKNVSDAVFSSGDTNVGVNTTVAPIVDIQQLIEDNASKYEDGGLDFADNELVDGKGLVGIDTLLTIDSGNQSSSQTALSDNGFALLSLYNYLKMVGLPSE